MAIEPTDANAEDSSASENRIPESRVQEMIGAAKDSVRSDMSQQIADLRQQVLSVQQQTVAPAEPVAETYTAGQLQGFVDDGKLTQEQMITVLLQQQKDELTTEFNSNLQQTLENHDLGNKLAAEMMQYRDKLPDLAVEGSATQNKAGKIYADLLARGHPKGLSTELVAVEQAFGPVNRIGETTLETRERHVETGGAGGSPSDPSGARPPKLSPRMTTHYQNMISNGHYSGWDDARLKSELEHVKSS